MEPKCDNCEFYETCLNEEDDEDGGWRKTAEANGVCSGYQAKENNGENVKKTQ